MEPIEIDGELFDQEDLAIAFNELGIEVVQVNTIDGKPVEVQRVGKDEYRVREIQLNI